MRLLTRARCLLSVTALCMFAISAVCRSEVPPAIAQERPAIRRVLPPGSGFPAGGMPGAPRIEASPYEGRTARPNSDLDSEAIDIALPDDALKVLTQFRNQEAERRAALERELQPARQRAIEELEALQDRLTRAGKLDEAIAVRAQVRRLRAEHPGVTQDSGNLYAYRGRTGLVLLINVTGAIDGPVYGTGIYTDDSDLSTAAVHAGVLKVGETNLLKVTTLPGQNSYTASSSNGVTSYDYSTWGGSYRIEKTTLPIVNPQPRIVPAPIVTRTPNLQPLEDSIYERGAIGDQLTLRVRGSADGFVWGSGSYTDDSSVGTAAVHAGILAVGEVGTVTVRIETGLASYKGSAINGVTSRDYHSWPRSFSFVIEERRKATSDSGSTPTHVISDPGTLLEYRSKIGESFLFDVTGSTAGFVYGSDVYTDDSTLASVIVHAGIVKPGERTVVKVTMLPGRDSYTATIRNGIESRSWGTWSASFSVKNFGYPTKAK